MLNSVETAPKRHGPARLTPMRPHRLLRPRALLHLYRRRLRAHAVQEVLAGFGVAVAVALIFAVLAAQANISNSTNEVVHAVVGPATLQLRARGTEGFDERTLSAVDHLPGVKQAAPLLEQQATIVASDGRRVTVDLAGADASLTILNGLLHTIPIAVLSEDGISLSEATARALNLGNLSATSGRSHLVSLRLRGRAYSVPINAVLGAKAVGALSQAIVAVMPLTQLQRLADLPGRISRILVQPATGHEAAVRVGLERIAAGDLTVAPANRDVALLREALSPSNLATGMFASIAGLLGVLLAANALLLTIPDRRQAIADLRLAGARRGPIVQMILSQAFVLGLLASLIGVLLGYVLSRGALRPATGYLSQAFALGNHTAVGVGAVLIAFAGGVLAISVCSAVLLRDLRRGRELDAVYLDEGSPGNALERSLRLRLTLAGVVLLVIAAGTFAFAPQLALGSAAALALATILAVPLALTITLRLASELARHMRRLARLLVAVTTLRGASLRSLALTATSALALFGAVALGGARQDLLGGLSGFANTYTAGADLWVLNQGDPLAVDSFQAGDYATRLASVPGVAGIEPMQSEYLDVGKRRVWLTAREPSDAGRLLREQVVEGNPGTAITRLRERGWIVISQQLAAEQHARVGHTLLLPTPTGVKPVRVAATTTNFGWSPGAILISRSEHERLWGNTDPTALGVHLIAGASVERVRQALTATLGPDSGLEVVTASERAHRFLAIAREGLGQLADITVLLTIAAILAMAAALGSAIWQRRPALAAMRISGASPRGLRGVLASEAALMLAAGCITGILGGLCGQAVLDGYLKDVTGFPVGSITASWQPLELLGILALAVAVLLAWPAVSASRVRPEVALDE